MGSIQGQTERSGNRTRTETRRTLGGGGVTGRRTDSVYFSSSF